VGQPRSRKWGPTAEVLDRGGSGGTAAVGVARRQAEGPDDEAYVGRGLAGPQPDNPRLHQVLPATGGLEEPQRRHFRLLRLRRRVVERRTGPEARGDVAGADGVVPRRLQVAMEVRLLPDATERRTAIDLSGVGRLDPYSEQRRNHPYDHDDQCPPHLPLLSVPCRRISFPGVARPMRGRPSG